MFDEVEKTLILGGILISLGVGGLFGFWWGVVAAGALLFGVAFTVFMSSLRGVR